MQRYCLTQCAKDKLSRGWKLIINIITAILFAILIVVGAAAVSATVGAITLYIAQNFGFLLETPYYECVPLGVTVIIITFLGGLVLYYLFLFLKWLFLGIKGIVTNQVNKYQGNDYEKCKIFEKCIEEPEDKKNGNI